MKDFHSRKREKKSPFTQPLSIAVLFLLVLLLLRSTYHSYNKKRMAQKEQLKFENKYLELIRKKKRLLQKINLLDTKEGMKEVFKKVYDVGEEGEVIIHITE